MIGWGAREVYAASFWQFRAAVEGWKRANSTEEEAVKPPTPEEHDALMAKYA